MTIPISRAVIAMKSGRAKRCIRGFKRGLEICSSEHIRLCRHPERSAAESKDPAASYFTGFLDFARDDGASDYFHRTFRKRFQKGPAVRAGHDAVVEDHDNTLIALRPNEPAYALTKFQDRLGQRIFREGIAATRLHQFQLRFDQGMIRHRKRQSCDDDIRERFARNIDTHPKTIGPEKDAARCRLELLEQFAARRALSLHEEIHLVPGKERFHFRGELLHSAITREENEGAALR